MAFELLAYQVGHDPCRTTDRAPAGAVPAGIPVDVLLRVDAAAAGLVVSACALVQERIAGRAERAWREVPLVARQGGFAGRIELEHEPHVAFYAFRVELADGSQAYCVPRADGRSTAGEVVFPGIDGEWGESGWQFDRARLAARPTGDAGLPDLVPGFQVTVYDPAFRTPEWLAGAVMYQIFPDRFARGAAGLRREGVAYHGRLDRPVRLHADWDEAPDWGDADYDPVDFFGGTLAGIRSKLAYLESLGVEVLYLNPIFEARSNHRYDTADYLQVDPLLGTGEDFALLVQEARDRGISLVLDAVLSHTGADSRYFNALGSYAEPGAAQGSQSPYFAWYDFDHPNGTLAPYRCWWGDPTLPEVNELEPSWQRFVLGESGVLATWLWAGARGYRLDVADELPDEVLERIRACVKGASPDAAIIGEVWEDATVKESYGAPRTYALGRALDSTMNYPLRSALLGFALGCVDAHQLVAFLRLQQANYPAPLHACLMNLLGSHDVERLRTVLSLGRTLGGLTRAEQADLVGGVTAAQDARGAELQCMIAGLLFALPGAPCVYYGDERGLHGGADPFCRATFPWEDAAGRADCGRDLTGVYQQLGRLRKGSAALRTGAFACAAPHADVVCVLRVGGDGEVVLAVANRGAEPVEVAFDALAPELALDSRIGWALSGPFAQFEPIDADAPATCECGIVRCAAAPCATRYWKWQA